MASRKKGQIWIETVLYTLIGLALIGMILAFTLPKITKTQEKILIEQTISSLKTLDQTISSVVSSGPDNIRSYELSFKEGELFIDGRNDKIYFQIDDLKDYYSQPDVSIEDGRVKILSFGKEGASSVKLELNYTNYANITYNGADVEQKITKSAVSYKFFLSNLGSQNGNPIKIDIKLG
ncbi:MAG: hypothetical protein AABW82_03435 [Nanoarchaeota archaeon]